MLSKKKLSPLLTAIVLLLVVAVPLGIYAAIGLAYEPENGVLSGNFTVGNDANASGGKYIQYMNNPTQPPTNNSFQPTAPYYGTFYYMWYQNPNTDGNWSYWPDGVNNPPSTWFSHYLPNPNTSVFDPSTELYSSKNYTNFKWQVSKMKEAKLEFAIASWWGQGRKEDAAFNSIIHDFMGRSDNPYPNLRWAMYYEDEGFNDPSVAEIVTNLNYIKQTYATSPYFLTVQGKPVVFVYAGANDIPGTMTTRWSQANQQLGNYFYINLKVFGGFATDANQPNSWHQYAPAVRSGSFATYSSFVSPGFWLDGDPERLPRDPTAFESAVQSMVASSTTWKLVETWNEWGEGTSVEPGQQVKLNSATGKEELDTNGYVFDNLYIDILKRNLPTLE